MKHKMIGSLAVLIFLGSPAVAYTSDSDTGQVGKSELSMGQHLVLLKWCGIVPIYDAGKFASLESIPILNGLTDAIVDHENNEKVHWYHNGRGGYEDEAYCRHTDFGPSNDGLINCYATGGDVAAGLLGGVLAVPYDLLVEFYYFWRFDQQERPSKMNASRSAYDVTVSKWKKNKANCEKMRRKLEEHAVD